MDRAQAIEDERAELANGLRAHLARPGNGSEGIVVLTRSEGDVIALLLDQLARDEGLTPLGLLAADAAAVVHRQTGF